MFRRCLAHSKGLTPAERRLWRDGIYAHIRDVMSQQGSLNIERMCQLVPVSRAGFYRSLQELHPVEEEMAVRDAIQHIALAHRRRYGYRRIRAELRRRGLLVNHKRVARLMRDDTLLAVQPRTFLATTDARHDLAVYLNLASRLTLTGLNQVWVADITCIACARSSSIWPSSSMGSRARSWARPWRKHWRRACRWPHCTRPSRLSGIQYASGTYVQLLRQHHIIPRMSRPANPYNNASCESFLKTFKREEIYASSYRDLDHLRTNIAAFIDQYYNGTRLHSALGYQPPEEFERGLASGTSSAAASMQLFRPEEESPQEGMPY